MKNIYLSVLACVIILASCGENNQNQAGPAGSTQNSYTYPSSLNQEQQNNSTPTTTAGTINMQPVKANENSTGTLATNAKLNPEHGQPGHRCDIAVGAPLDGSVQPTTTTSMQPTQAVTIDPQTGSKTQNTANLKINPAHGQPGHRCDIAVGAPLDGSQKTNSSSAQTTTQPVTVNPSTTNSNLKINPAHGQPGHRCDIAVGAPLDGSTATKTTVQPTESKSPLQYFQPVIKPDTTKN